MVIRLAFMAVMISAPLVAQSMPHEAPVTPVVNAVAEANSAEDFEIVRYPFAQWIHEYSERFQVDHRLVVSVIRAESGFNPRAVSPAGARGLMQLMPETARGLGVRNSFDPRENIRGGVQHLSYLLARYDGNTKLAVAAYNAGEVAVDRYKGVPPYEETRNYVRVVLREMEK